MVHSNKILTVSYGTFSCTLEGFDDSFGTMKAIAEYFRDLASDDRYFGAEPPQPDAEMLARIAQREISRQVEARRDDSGIVLRAKDYEAPAALTAAAAVANAAPRASNGAQPAAEQAEAPEPAPEPVAEPAAEPAAELAPEPAPVAEAPVADPFANFAPGVPAETAYVAPVTAEPVAAEPVAEPVAEPIAEPVIEEPMAAEPMVAEPMVAEPAAEPVAEVFTPDPAAGSDPGADSIAAKLQRIRAVVSQNEAATQTGAFSEDEHADAFVSAAAQDLTEALKADEKDADYDEMLAADDEISRALARYDTELVDSSDDDSAGDVEDTQTDSDADTDADTDADADPDDADLEVAGDAADQAPVADDDADEADWSDSFMPAADAADPVLTDVEDDYEDVVDSDQDADTDDLAAAELADNMIASEDDADEPQTDLAGLQIAEDADAEARADDQDQDDSGLFADLDDSDDVSLDDELSNILRENDEDLADEDLADDSADDGDDDADGPMGARLLRVKRSDLEAAIAAGDLEEIEDTDEDQSSLSADDEADLLRELAAVEAELNTDLDGAMDDDDSDDDDGFDTAAADSTDDGTIDDDAMDDDTMPDDVDTHHGLAASGAEEDEDISRLMAAADQKMGDPETSSSRETYEQLRAAVAAAEAEKSAGGDMAEDSGDEAYRRDLASVVRPRRPVATATARPSRPVTEERPAPLKLVAEQRVDDGEGISQRGPVSPRRVAADDQEEAMLDAEDNDSGFAAFATEMGATELPDLLEAAAAYMSFVEGRDQFSRPQLMNKVRQVESGGFNREDGLRSFGLLLREGKIEKAGGGRFTASGEIGFRPDEREAG